MAGTAQVPVRALDHFERGSNALARVEGAIALRDRNPTRTAGAIGSGSPNQGGFDGRRLRPGVRSRGRKLVDRELRLRQGADRWKNAIDGLIVHTAGFDKDAGVFRIMDVWESQAQAERFIAERVQPLMQQGLEALPDPENATPPTREAFYELHDVRK